MKIKCNYCAKSFDEKEERCPYCGGINEQFKVSIAKTNRNSNASASASANAPKGPKREPRTIEELKLYCEVNGYTAEKTRFFIGEDYKNPKAFGIYKDENGDFVVYKNKANGERAIRYKGKNERHAVSELYARLQGEIQNQKLHYKQRQGSSTKSTAAGNAATQKKSRIKLILVVAAILALYSIPLIKALFSPKRGYYNYGGSTYYRLSNSWYSYDRSLSDWILINDIPQELSDNYKDYYTGGYSSEYNVSNFENTDYYQDWKDSQDNDDSGWSSDDWDSGSTDWDSDW